MEEIYTKKEIDEILNESKTVDPEVSAREILRWTIDNVESFIDNHKKIYKLDMIFDTSDTMKESKKIQDLYRSIPGDEDVIPKDIIEKAVNNESFELGDEYDEKLKPLQDCRKSLDEITQKIYLAMKNNSEMLKELFDRMIFYYELKGVKDGTLLMQAMEGHVDILKFEYESFPVSVKVKSPKLAVRNEQGEINEIAPSSEKEYVIPEGFALWIELAYKPKIVSTSIF